MILLADITKLSRICWYVALSENGGYRQVFGDWTSEHDVFNHKIWYPIFRQPKYSGTRVNG